MKYESPASYGSKVMTEVKFFNMYVKGHDRGHEVKYFCTDGKVLLQGIHM